jgi:hypothetical protein
MNQLRFSATTFVVCAASFSAVVLLKYGVHHLRGQGVKEPPTTIVLVAKKEVPAFTLLNDPEEFFEERRVPLDHPSVPAALKTFEELKDKSLRKALHADTVVGKEDLWTPHHEHDKDEAPPLIHPGHDSN